MLKKLLIRAVVLLAVIGYFRGWYSFSSSKDADSSHIGVSIDTSKVRDDAAKAQTRVKELKDAKAHE